MLLVLVQSTIFVWQPARGAPIWLAYLGAWKQTFTLAKKVIPFLFPVQNKKDAREATLVIVWLALCVPGFFIAGHALNLLK